MLRKCVWCILLLVAVLLIMVEANGKRSKTARRNGNGQHGKDCSEWTFDECTVQGSTNSSSSTLTCGKGTKKGVRTGDNCSLKEKLFPCRVPCPKSVKNKCKYQKGEWSECDAATNTMSRTNTLKKGDATMCQASKVITKKCKNKKASRSQPNRKRKQPSSRSD